MSTEEVLQQIKEWENKSHESFIDYFDCQVNPAVFMYWCLGKGYQHRSKFLLWEMAFNCQESSATTLNDYLISDTIEYAIVFASEEYDYKVYEDKALRILAEFISQSVTYTHRMNKLIKRREEE